MKLKKFGQIIYSLTNLFRNRFSELQNDMSSLLHSLLNLNSTVAQRFLPVAKMSPILSDVNASLLDENHLGEAFSQGKNNFFILEKRYTFLDKYQLL